MTEARQDEMQMAKETEYPAFLRLAAITIGLCLAIFCMALDNTIISTAVPRITDEFHSINDIGWYGSAYLLTTCAFQLFYGRLYTFFSIKWVYVGAMVIFEVGSAVCGAAPSSAALIVGRAIAGIGAAGMFSGALLIIAEVVPLRSRPTFTGIIGAMYGISSIVGPLLGGAFTDRVTWRWCFYINLPIGAVTIVFLALFSTSPTPKVQMTMREKLTSLDILGTLLFVPSIVSLLLALQWGGSTYAWYNWRIILLFVLFGVLLIAFIGVQIWRGEAGTVPPRIISVRSIAAGGAFAGCLGASFFVMSYYIPIWFQAVQLVSATESGTRNLALLVAMVLAILFAGGLVTRFGYFTPFMIMSSILAAIGAGLLSTFQPDTSTGEWIGYQIIYGVGVGLGFQQPIVAVQAVLPAVDIPVGTAVVVFCQTLGGATFLSVAQNIFFNKLVENLMRLVPALDPMAIAQQGATGITTSVPQDMIPMAKQAYSQSITQVFYVAVALSVLSIFGAMTMGLRLNLNANEEQGKSTSEDEKAQLGATRC